METYNDDENSTVSIVSALVRKSIGNDIIPQADQNITNRLN